MDSWFFLDGYSLLRFCGALAIFILFYYFLMDRKASFFSCRIYLLFIVVFAGLIACIRIPVYPAEKTGAFVRVESTVENKKPELNSQEFIPELITSEKSGNLPEVVSEIENGLMSWEVWRSNLNRVNVFWLIYSLGTLIISCRLIFAMLGIMRMKQWGTCYRWDGLLIVKNNRVNSPFSFIKMIFINRKLTGETLEVILAHEKCHIQHKHYRDTLLMEIFCVFFWFNPFVWLVKRELKVLHEFEVDRCLLANGLELSKYQNIIFDELMGYGPAIANGFHNSMIKKRFIMMKNASTIKYRLVRKMILFPAFAGIVALFSFTEKQALTEQVVLPDMQEVPVVDLPGSVFTPLEPSPKSEKEEVLLVVERNREQVQVDTFYEKLQIISPVVEKHKKPFVGREGITFYPLREDQVVVSLIPFERREIVKYIETDRKETRVTLALPIYFDSNWVQFDKGLCIVDRETGDAYMIRSMTRGIELNKTLTVEGKRNRMAEFTMVFPPLKRGVKYIDIYQKFPEMQAPMPSNGESTRFMNLKVADYLPPKDIDKYYDKEGRPLVPRTVEYVELRDDQVVESPRPMECETNIVSIEREKNETRVTIAVPIEFDRHWVQFDKGFCMEDCKTGDVYQIRSLAKDIELNKTLVVVGKKGKMVEFTMIFPALKKKVKRVNMYTKYWEQAALAPSNGSPWNWRGVKVAEYEKKGKIYY